MNDNAEDPVVSVVLPAYNAARTIHRAVRSVLDQSLRQLELIVVDDGSTDDTAQVIRSIEDPRLRLVQQTHQGVVAAANRGVAESKTDYIARMDADDFSYPDRLRGQLELLRKTQADVVGCQVSIVDSRGSGQPTLTRYEQWINQETMSHDDMTSLRFVELPLVNPTIFARRCYFELGFRNNDLPEDYDLMLRAAASGLRFAKVSKVLFEWVDHQQRLTRTNPCYTTDAFDRCRRQHLLKGPLCNARLVDVWGAGQTGKPWLRWLFSEAIQVRHVYDVHPRKIGEMWQGIRIRSASELEPPDGTPLLIAVGAKQARQIISPQLEVAGYRRGVDAWFVA